MATTSLNLTKRIRDGLANAEARALIGAVLTLGFVGVQILAIYNVVNTDTYVVIMQWYVPIQAVVVGFYFGTPKPTPALGSVPSITPSELVEVIQRLSRNQTLIVQRLDDLTARLARVQVSHTGEATSGGQTAERTRT